MNLYCFNLVLGEVYSTLIHVM